ncbi:MAG: hypothetical protein WC444_01830 [Candidatus Paceibacterota bacterium]
MTTSQKHEDWQDPDEVGKLLEDFKKNIAPFLQFVGILAALGFIFGYSYINWDLVWKKIEPTVPILAQATLIGTALSLTCWYQLSVFVRRSAVIVGLIAFLVLLYSGVTTGRYHPLYR